MANNKESNTDECKKLYDKLEIIKNDLYTRGLNILDLAFDIKQDGTNTSEPLYNALKYCRDNNYTAIVPKGIYTVGQFPNGDGTTWKCVPIPDGLTMHILPGTTFKLLPNSPKNSRVIVPGNDITIYGELRIDGSAETITAGNEHMAGLFVFGKKNVYIESVVSQNCYGDNIQLSGDSSGYSDGIIIDRVRCEKAGRANLVLEAVSGVHIKNATLNNKEGGSTNWSGSDCLHVEPFDMGNNKFYNRIDFLETSNSNSFSAGTTPEKAGQYRVDIGTLIQNTGDFKSFAMSISIDNAHFGEGFGKINLMYAANLNIRCADFINPKDTVILTQSSAGYQPKLHIDSLYIEGNPTLKPTNPAIYWRGSSLYIGRIRVDNFNNKLIWSQYTNSSDLNIEEIIANNSGLASGSLIYLDYYTNRGSCSIGQLVVRDSRTIKLNKIIEYSDPQAMDDFGISKLHNPDKLALYGTQYGNFDAYYKLAGLDGGVSIVLVTVNPEEKITLPKGSIALMTDTEDRESTIYIKQSGVGNTGWYPLQIGGIGITAQRPTNPWVGMQYYDKTLKKPIWLDNIGTKSKVVLTISDNALASGKISITLNGITTAIEVNAGDTAGFIGNKILSTTFKNWSVDGTVGSGTITFTKSVTGKNLVPTFSDTDSTGVTASFKTVVDGNDNVWVDAMGNIV